MADFFSSSINVRGEGLSDCTVCDGGLSTNLFLSSIFRLPIDSKGELLSHMFAFAMVTVCQGIRICFSRTSMCTVEQ